MALGPSPNSKTPCHRDGDGKGQKLTNDDATIWPELNAALNLAKYSPGLGVRNSDASATSLIPRLERCRTGSGTGGVGQSDALTMAQAVGLSRPSFRTVYLMTMKSIAEDIANKYNLQFSELLNKSKQHIYSHPRQEAMATMKQNGFTNKQISNFFKFKSHATTVRGISAYCKRLGNFTVDRIFDFEQDWL